MPINITVEAIHIHLTPDGLTGKLDEIINYLKEIIMDKAQFAAALNDVATTLTGVGEQLTKATAEIVAAVANAGFSDPALDAALANLQLVAATLEGASQGLDDLNPDVPA